MDYQKICINCMREKPEHDLGCPYCGYYSAGSGSNGKGFLPPYTILKGRYLIGTVQGRETLDPYDFSVVYIAMDLVLERIVTVQEFYSQKYMRRSTRMPEKVALLQVQDGNLCQQNQKGFMRAAIVLMQQGALPGIAEVYDYFEENWTSYVVQEYIPGITLLNYINKKGRMEMKEILQRLYPVCQSLQQLHQAGILHCDIWPGNLVVDNAGSVKLVNFLNIPVYGHFYEANTGVSSSVRNNIWRKIVQPCSVQGDIYGLAMTICFCLGGNVRNLSGSLSHDTLRQAGAPISAGMEAVLQRGIAVDCGSRYYSVGEFLAALRSQYGQDQKNQETPDNGQEGRKRKKKKQMLTGRICAAAAAVTLIVGGTAAWKWMRHGQERGINTVAETPQRQDRDSDVVSGAGDSGSDAAHGTSGSSTSSDMSGKEKTDDSYTVMVYMVGSDLESYNGAASDDITEIIESGVDFSKNRVILYTGGSSQWMMPGIPADQNTVYEVSKNGLKEVASTPAPENMGRSETLLDFLDYCYQNYPADHFGLVLWDHGSGPVYGFGNDEQYNYDALLLKEMEDALEASAFGPENKLDWVGYDACMMAGIELADLWDDYAQYLIASQESEPGYGWNYNFLANLNDTHDPLEISESIINFYGEFYSSVVSEFFNPEITLSCMDLSQTAGTVEALDALFEAMEQDVEQGQYSALAKSRNTYKRYGLTAAGKKSDSLDLVDLKNMAQALEAKYPSEVSALQDWIDHLVIYGVANVESGGVSIYYPYDNKLAFQEVGQKIYPDILDSSGYQKYIDSFSDIWLNSSLDVDWNITDISKGGKNIEVSLSEEQQENICAAYYTVMKVNGDGLYTPVLSDCEVEVDSSGTLHIPLKPKLFFVVADDTVVGWPVAQAETAGTEIVYTTEGILVLSDMMENLGIEGSESVIVSFSLDEENEVVTILDIKRETAENTIHSGKNEISMEEWGYFGWSLSCYEPTYGATGEIQPCAEWKESDVKITGSVPVLADFFVNYREVTAADGEYVCQVILKDTVGEYHASGIIEL